MATSCGGKQTPLSDNEHRPQVVKLRAFSMNMFVCFGIFWYVLVCFGMSVYICTVRLYVYSWPVDAIFDYQWNLWWETLVFVFSPVFACYLNFSVLHVSVFLVYNFTLSIQVHFDYHVFLCFSFISRWLMTSFRWHRYTKIKLKSRPNTGPIRMTEWQLKICLGGNIAVLKILLQTVKLYKNP